MTIQAFERTVQKTNLWLHEIADELKWEDRQRAYVALCAVLHALRNRLTVAEATDLAPSCRCWCAVSITKDGTRRGLPWLIIRPRSFCNT